MHTTIQIRRLAALVLCTLGVAVASAQTAPAPEAKAAATAVREKARKGSATGSDLQKLMEQINSQREKMIADHEALARQLRDATEEQRRAILERMHEQKRAFEAAQSALHKEIRDEQRRQRQQAAPGKR